MGPYGSYLISGANSDSFHDLVFDRSLSCEVQDRTSIRTTRCMVGPMMKTLGEVRDGEIRERLA